MIRPIRTLLVVGFLAAMTLIATRELVSRMGLAEPPPAHIPEMAPPFQAAAHVPPLPRPPLTNDVPEKDVYLGGRRYRRPDGEVITLPADDPYPKP